MYKRKIMILNVISVAEIFTNDFKESFKDKYFTDEHYSVTPCNLFAFLFKMQINLIHVKHAISEIFFKVMQHQTF